MKKKDIPVEIEISHVKENDIVRTSKEDVTFDDIFDDKFGKKK